jgi:hypothetical protein
MGADLVLSAPEKVTLVDCEAVIERGVRTFVEVGNALLTIRDERLYRDGFATFEAYCQERWGFSRQRAHQLTSAAEVVTTIVDTGLPAPANEGQARELAKAPEEQRAEVWRETVERTDGKPTAAAVREVRNQLVPVQPDIAQPIDDSWPSIPKPGSAAVSSPALPPPAAEPATNPIATTIADAKTAAKTAPAHIAYKALEHMNLARQIIGKAGGVDAVIDDLANGPIDPTDVWLIPIESAMATFEELRAGLRRRHLRSVR